MIKFKIVNIERTRCQIGSNRYTAEAYDDLENDIHCTISVETEPGEDPTQEELRGLFLIEYKHFVDGDTKIQSLEIGDIL